MLGYFFDDEADTYFVRARHYDPVTGRWLSQDPIAYEGSPGNLYEYVAVNPIRFLDPSGMQANFFPPGWPWNTPKGIPGPPIEVYIPKIEFVFCHRACLGSTEHLCTGYCDGEPIFVTATIVGGGHIHFTIFSCDEWEMLPGRPIVV